MQSTAKVFEEDIKATPVTNIGSVQHVTEKPGFGLSVDQSPSRPKGNLPLVGLFNENDLDDDDQEDANPTGLVGRIQQRIAAKKNFQQDFKARLKSRFDRFKQKQEQAEDTNVGRGSVSPISLNRSSFGRSFSGSRNRGQSSSEFRSRSSAEITTEQADLVSEPSELQPVSSRAPRQRFRSRIRGSPSRIEPVTIELKKESVEELLNSKETSSRPSFRTRNRNRFRDRASVPKRTSQEEITTKRPTFNRPKPNFSSRNTEVSNPKPKISFKRFNRFDRPDVRKTLLEKILSKGKGENTVDPEEAEAAKKAAEAKAALEKKDDIAPLEVNDIDSSGQTTLKVFTVFPENREKDSTYMEIATIRSPYSFAIDEGMSTRFITVTR